MNNETELSTFTNTELMVEESVDAIAIDDNEKTINSSILLSNSTSQNISWTAKFLSKIVLDEDKNLSEIQFIILTLSFIVLSMAGIYIVVILYDKFRKRSYNKAQTEDGKEMTNMSDRNDPETAQNHTSDNE